jgi:drug/metabolite transporter (DMT)-like permease
MKPVPPGQYAITESVFNVPFSLVICFHSGIDVSPLNIGEKQWWFWGRVIFGGVATGFKILVIRHMELGDATAIIFTAPIWAGCLARIVLKEKYTIINLVATIFGLGGILLVTQPKSLFPSNADPDQPKSSVTWKCAALSVALLAAVSYVCVRGAGKGIPPMKFVLYTAVVKLIAGFVMNPIMKEDLVLPPCDWIKWALFACGVGATVGNLLAVKGLSLENSGPATLMRNWDIVYAYVFQIAIDHIDPDWMSLLGAAIIVAAAVLQGADRIFDISCGISF